MNFSDTPTGRSNIAKLIIGIGALLFIGSIIPNFSSPVTTSKPGLALRDMRTMQIALETYYLENNSYPAWSADPALNAFGDKARKSAMLARLPTFTISAGAGLKTLTTPVSYLSAYYPDPYAPVTGATYCYWVMDMGKVNKKGGSMMPSYYLLWSPGPDGKYDLTLDNITKAYDPATTGPSTLLIRLTYDPTNGPDSGGDIYRLRPWY